MQNVGARDGGEDYTNQTDLRGEDARYKCPNYTYSCC